MLIDWLLASFVGWFLGWVLLTDTQHLYTGANLALATNIAGLVI
jgi:hypothetical protein